MQQTENYNLNVPELTDVPDITKVSENFPVIDGLLKTGQDKDAALEKYANEIAANTYVAGLTPFAVNTASIDAYGNENLLYSDTSTTTGEVAFMQPLLSANGTMWGNAFAVNASRAGAFNAFDGNEETAYLVTGTSSITLEIYNPTPIKLTGLSIYSKTQMSNMGVEIRGKNTSAETATLIDTITPINFDKTLKTFSITTNTKYKYFSVRIGVTNATTVNIGVNEIKLAGTVTGSTTTGGSVLRFRGGLSGKTAKNKYFELSEIPNVSVTGLNGLYSVFVTPVGSVDLFSPDVIAQKQQPTTAVANQIWLKTLEPLTAYVYRNNSWVEYEGVPVGEVTVNNGTVADVYTFPYNQNQYSINAYSVATASTFGVMRVASVEDEVNCNCEDATVTPANLYDVENYRIANTTYAVGDLVGCPYHADLYLEATTAGITDNAPLDTREVVEGQTLTDGGVIWQATNVSSDELDLINMRNSETNFKIDAFIKAQKQGCKTLFIELFDTVADVDATKGDAAQFINRFWNERKHIFIKDDTATYTIYSVMKTVDKPNTQAWRYLHWDNIASGSVRVYISRDNGANYVEMAADDTNYAMVGTNTKQVIVKLVIAGKLKLKNIAWGVK